MDLYRINDPKYVFYLDQSGCSFAKITGRSLRKGVGSRNVVMIRSSVRMKGALDSVTVMWCNDTVRVPRKWLGGRPAVQRGSAARENAFARGGLSSVGQ